MDDAVRGEAREIGTPEEGTPAAAQSDASAAAVEACAAPDDTGAREINLARGWLRSAETWLGDAPNGSDDADLVTKVASGIREFMRLIHEAPAPAAEIPLSEFVRVARCFTGAIRLQGRTAADIAGSLERLAPVLREACIRGEKDVSSTDPTGGKAGLPADAHSAAQRLTAAIAGVIVEEEIRERRELSGTIDVFTQTLAHELKNPIGAAAGGAQMILDDAIAADPEQRRRFAEMIARNLRRATSLVTDLRLIIAAREGENAASRPRRLGSIVGDVFHEVRGAAAEAGVELVLLEPLPELDVDSARISLALMNLVWNAVKYSDRQKPESWVRVGAHHTPGEGWTCFVADNGLGIPEDHRDRVFERFHRVHTDAAPGTGLGLSITREAIEQLGGRIWLESVEGTGSTFHFTLPAKPDPDLVSK